MSTEGDLSSPASARTRSKISQAAGVTSSTKKKKKKKKTRTSPRIKEQVGDQDDTAGDTRSEEDLEEEAAGAENTSALFDSFLGNDMA